MKAPHVCFQNAAAALVNNGMVELQYENKMAMYFLQTILPARCAGQFRPVSQAPNKRALIEIGVFRLILRRLV